MKYGNKYSLKRLLTEKFELDKPLDTSLEDWKGYFEKSEDLDSAVKDDFLAAREMADEAIEMLDDERDNIVAALEEIKAAKEAKEKEAEEARKKQEEEDKKQKDLLNRLKKKGAITEEEWKAGKDDNDEIWNKYTEIDDRLMDYLNDTFMWGMKNQRMDVCQQVQWFLGQSMKIKDIAKKFAYPDGIRKGAEQRGYYGMIQSNRARLALTQFLFNKCDNSFFWQGDFPSVDQLVDKLPPPQRLSKLLDEK